MAEWTFPPLEEDPEALAYLPPGMSLYPGSLSCPGSWVLGSLCFPTCDGGDVDTVSHFPTWCR